jgi:S-formylglutathione hydrolase FrmB
MTDLGLIVYHGLPLRQPPRRHSILAGCLCALLAMVIGQQAPTRSAVGGEESLRRTRLAPKIERIEFHSHVLGRKMPFCIVRPRAALADGERWPVLYLLHGRGRHERSLIDDPRSRRILAAAPFATVLPKGEDGWYVNSPVRSADRYADYLEEVINVAEANLPVSRRPEGRALAGWSMGGYGCTMFAATHPGQFASLAPIIGLLDFPRDGLPRGQGYEVPRDRFGADADVWRRFNPRYRVRALRGTSVLVITADRAFDRTMNENFRAALRQNGVAYRWEMLRGGHTFDVVVAALPLVVQHTVDVLLQ